PTVCIFCFEFAFRTYNAERLNGGKNIYQPNKVYGSVCLYADRQNTKQPPYLNWRESKSVAPGNVSERYCICSPAQRRRVQTVCILVSKCCLYYSRSCSK